MVAFTWNIATFEGTVQISKALSATAPAAAPHSWCLDGNPTDDANGDTECWLSFKTSAGDGKAHLRLNAQGKATTFLTVLANLERQPFAIGRHRPLGHPCQTLGEIATPILGRPQWHERRAASLPVALGGHAGDPYVLIIGGGQGGLSLGARLKLLGVPYIIVERHPRVGDSWRSRYPSLLLHDPVWYDHMPYMPFPECWPVFTPRDKIADWLEMYSKAMDLDIALNTSVVHAVPPLNHGEDSRWTVQLEGATLRPAHVVFATGMSGYPSVPDPPGHFDGECMHSSAYPGAAGGRFSRRRAVVVGSNTSAHDICQDLWEQGAASVTMLQRSAGLIVSEESILTLGLGALYSEDALERGVSHELADLIATTLPYRLQEERWKAGTTRMRQKDAKLHAALEAAGYQLDFGFDGTGVFGKSLRQGGGFYIDVGSAALIADGRVGLRSGCGATVARLDGDAVLLESGERIPTDLLIYATGYSSMHNFVADIVSPTVAESIGRVWGYGSGAAKDPGPWLGELRNMWKPTTVPGLWFSGGNLAQARHYSRLLSLQLAARYLGLQTPVYGTIP